MPRSTRSLSKRSTIASLKANLTALASFLGTEISDINRKHDDLASHVGRDAADQTCHNSAVGTDLKNLFDQMHVVQEWVLELQKQNKVLGSFHARLQRLETSVCSTNNLLDRLTDHINREIGVAQDVPLHQRVELMEARYDALLDRNTKAAEQPDPGFDQKDEQPLGTCVKCQTPLKDAPGIAIYCPNKACDELEQPANIVATKKETDAPVAGTSATQSPSSFQSAQTFSGADWAFKDKVLFTHFFRPYPVQEVKVPAPGFYTWTVELRPTEWDQPCGPEGYFHTEITKYIVARTITAAVTLVYEQHPELSGAYVVVDCWRD